MKYKFPNNKLETMANVMNVPIKKGTIDYTIFNQNEWSEKEEQEIKEYLKADILATKGLFDKLWDYWLPFTKLLDDKNIKNLSWIKNSIASMIYKANCHKLGVEPIYTDKKSEKEDLGGRVILPKVEEKENVYYIDFSQLYPHLMCMANLFSECEPDDNNPLVWHGNEVFKVKGYYYIGKQHILSETIRDNLKQRQKLNETDPNNPMIYTIKIYNNAEYGIIRSSIFKQVHTPNAGHDTCFLGQQVQILTENDLKNEGYVTIGGDTDSLMIYATKEEIDSKEYLQKCLDKIVEKIKSNLPFPCDTFKIKIEYKLDYIMFPFSLQPIKDDEGNNIKKGNRLVKEWKGRKKNYLYIYTENGEKKIELVGLPIKKDNATSLSMQIFEEVLKPLILKNNKAKFSKQFIEKTIEEYLEKPGILESLAREFKCKPFHTYKNPNSQLQAQISKHHFYGQDGTINLIKNKKIGVGKGAKYCTIEDAKKNKLTIKDLDLTKLKNELHPFIEHNLDN